MGAPEEIVCRLLLRRHLEWCHFAAGGIDPTHHVFDRPVLTACIHGLQDDEHCVAAFGVQHVLKHCEPLDVAGEFRPRGVFVALFAAIVRIKAAEAHACAWTNKMVCH